MKKYIFSILLVIAFTSVSGQQLPILVPKSPEAAAFARYGEYPVSLATGVPIIEIPLYEIKNGDINVPIYLSYHASGIKVEDVATSAGLGWTLNAGGMITRTVNGAVDNGSFRVKSKQNAIEWMDFLGESISNYWKRWLIPDVGEDSQSDKYVYNFNGKSGVFLYNTLNSEIITVPYAPLNIETTINGFKITDVDGLVYYFEDKEYTATGSLYYCSSWYLTKIESLLTGNTILLKYKNGNFYYQTSYTRIIGRGIGNCWSDGFDPVTGDPVFTCSSFIEETQTVNTNHQIILLDEITWKDNIIKLNYTTDDRLDKYKDRLNSITIKSGTTTVKTIVLDNNHYFGNRSRNYRMKLAGIDILGNESESLGLKYTFTYNEKFLLPDYNNIQNTDEIVCNEDYWGYYNGKGWDYLDFIPQEYACFDGGTDRNPDSAKMKACILTEIKYPTGGSTSFVFEANHVTDAYDYNTGDALVGGLRIKKIISKTDNSTIIKSYEYSGYATQKIEKGMFQYEQMKLVSQADGNAYFQNGYYLQVNWHGSNNQMTTSSPLYPITGWAGNAVFYDNVTEYFGDKTSNTGKKVYTFINNLENAIEIKNSDLEMSGRVDIDPDEYPKLWETNCISSEYGYDVPRFYHPYHNIEPGLSQPLLVSESTYEFSDNKYTIRQGIQNYYRTVDKGSFICGVKLGMRIDHTHLAGDISSLEFFPFSSAQQWYEKNLTYYDVKALRFFKLLDETYTYTYNDNGTIISKTEFDYDPDYRLLTPVKKTIIKSNNESLTETVKYPFNYSNIEPYKTMNDRHILSPVIETSNFVGNATTPFQSTKNNYSFWKPSGNSLLASNIPTDNILISSVDYKTGSNPPETRLNYHEYDKYGNVLSVSKTNDIKNSYLWGYNDQYPIAQIENSSFTHRTLSNSLGSASAAGLSQSGLIQLSGTLSVTKEGIVTISRIYNKSELPQICIIYIYNSQQQIAATFTDDLSTDEFYNLTSDIHLQAGNYSAKVYISPYSNDPFSMDINISFSGSYIVTFPFYTSFEEDISNVSTSIYKTGRKSHTGTLKLEIPLLSSNDEPYILSFFAKNSPSAKWEYKEEIIPSNSSSEKTISGYAFIDEVRLYPKNALMTTYTYDPLIGMTSSTNANNVTTHYEYDEFGRLKYVKDDDGNILKSYEYHYKD